MTKTQLEKMYPRITIDGMTFVIRYACINEVPITKDDIIVDYEIEGFELLDTPEEMYKKYLNPPIVEPDKISILETENKRLWDTVEYLLMVTEQIPPTGTTLV